MTTVRSKATHMFLHVRKFISETFLTIQSDRSNVQQEKAAVWRTYRA